MKLIAVALTVKTSVGEWFGSVKLLDSHTRVAESLGVDRSAVSRTLELCHASGSVAKKLYPKDKAFRKLTTLPKLLILNLVIKKPGIYLEEIQGGLFNVLLFEVDVLTICRFLHNNGFTRQKLCLVATQRSEFIRQQYILDVSVYKPEMVIFLDETGADQRNALRRYGYSLRGIPLKNNTLLVRGEHVSGLAFMSTYGLLDVSIIKGTVNGDIFYDFVQKYLLPQLLPFNGVNPHSVVVMDNCSIHHVYQ